MMKQYTKDNKVINYPLSRVVIAERIIFNPTEAILLANGYTPYTPPAPEPYEPTEEELAEEKRMEEEMKLQDVKQAKIDRMAEIKTQLEEMDYLTHKQHDGEDMSVYGDYKDRRVALRAEYNLLQKELL